MSAVRKPEDMSVPELLKLKEDIDLLVRLAEQRRDLRTTVRAARLLLFLPATSPTIDPYFDDN